MLMGILSSNAPQPRLAISAKLTATDISWSTGGGNYFWAMAEMQFFTSSNLTGSPIAGTASVSSVRVGYPTINATLLNDGTTDNTGLNSWNSQENGGSPEWSMITFTVPTVVRSFRFWIPTFDNNYSPKAFKLTREYSDGSAYDYYSTTNTTGAWQNFITSK